MNYFICREILLDLQITGEAQLLSGFRVTESADSEGMDDANSSFGKIRQCRLLTLATPFLLKFLFSPTHSATNRRI
jgi:hypothetical protein